MKITVRVKAPFEFVLLAALACFGLGCHTQVQAVDDKDIYEGTVALGFEVSSFRPCGLDESWWIEGSEESAVNISEQYAGITQKPYEEVFARLRGLISEKGIYGHLGAYQRSFYVTEVIIVRSKQSGDCK